MSKITYQDRLNKFEEGWQRNGGSHCGTGSDVPRAQNAMKWIPMVAEKFDLKVINDAGGGDLNWIQHIDWDVDFQGYDIVPRHKDVIKLDITKDLMRPCDLIICRQVFIHLSRENIKDALDLFRQSGKYLISTNYHTPNKTNDDALFWHVRLTDEEYGLGEPLLATPDTNGLNDLALWRL